MKFIKVCKCDFTALRRHRTTVGWDFYEDKVSWIRGSSITRLFETDVDNFVCVQIGIDILQTFGVKIGEDEDYRSLMDLIMNLQRDV